MSNTKQVIVSKYVSKVLDATLKLRKIIGFKVNGAWVQLPSAPLIMTRKCFVLEHFLVFAYSVSWVIL